MSHEETIIESLNFLNFAGYNYVTDHMLYAIADINADDIPELILANCYEQMLVLYTLLGNEPVWLTGWTHRSRGSITADGIIYSRGSNSGFSSTFTSYRLDPGADRLTELTWYTTGWHEGGLVGPVMQEDILGEWRPSTQEEHDALLNQNDNPPNPIKINFIPIEQPV